jgi:glycosyltransferase involved in cell wall biosynthesis
MNVLISLSYYAPNISGLTNYAKILAEELYARGHNITIITSQHKKDLLYYENKNGIEIVRVPVTFKIGKGPIMLFFMFRALKYIEKADVVNCHLPQFESFILAFLAKIKRKKLILTYHTDLSWNGGILLKISKIYISISHYISAMLADKIIISSKDYAGHSWFLKLFSKKLIYIFPPVKLAEPNIRVSGLFKKRFELKQKYVIGAVARISSEKGIEYLLKAVPLLVNGLKEDFVVVIAGPLNPIGENDYSNKIKILLKKYNKYIKLTGELSDEDLACFYRSIDVLVLPSINSTEAFGMVQVEAMLNRIPVVASNLPGVRIPIQITGMGEIIMPKDAKNLAEKIILVVKNKNNYIKNYDKIKMYFSTDKIISSYEKVFSGISD